MLPVGLRTVRLRKDVRKAIERGHPWIYDRALRGSRPELSPGEHIQIADREDVVAVAFADPGSPIRARVLARSTSLEPGWVRHRAALSASLRVASPRLVDVTGFRAIHGEGDLMPGLVIDIYGDIGVVVFDGDAARAHWHPRLDQVEAGLRDGGLPLSRLWERGQGDPPDPIEIREGAARFLCDVERGQKTGFFFDQRENRRRVAELCREKTVLNLFGYTGGFSVFASLGGATRVTTVDSARPAVAAAERNIALSNLDRSSHELVVADAFEYLKSERRRFDVVVCDPPSFARRERDRERGLAAYRRLNRLAAARTCPDGLLVTSSCSSHVTEDDLRDVLGSIPGGVRIVEARTAGPDHPTLPAFPEGNYLKLLITATGPPAN